MTDEVTAPTTDEVVEAPKTDEIVTQSPTQAQTTGVSSAYGTAQATQKQPEAQTPADTEPSATNNQPQSTGDPMLDLFVTLVTMSLEMQGNYFDSHVLLHQQMQKIMENDYESIYSKPEEQKQTQVREETTQAQDPVKTEQPKEYTQETINAVNDKMKKINNELQQSIGQNGVTVEEVNEDQIPEYVRLAITTKRGR